MAQGIGRPWTKDEEDFIHENYHTMTDDEMGAIIGRSKFGVRTRRYRRGWKNPRQATVAAEVDGGFVWERISKWLTKKDAESMLEQEAGRGLAVAMQTRTGGKDGQNYAIVKQMTKRQSLNAWKTTEVVQPIPKVAFNMDWKNPWDVRSAPIHATLGGS